MRGRKWRRWDVRVDVGPKVKLTTQMQECLAGAPPHHIGVAVSGGSDSTALLVLIADWARENNATLLAATVNHGLRAGADAEAQQVADLCKKLEINHRILLWTDWDKKGNLQDQARRARHHLLEDWARENRINTIALGHTKDDQAETVLLRLMRGSGVDGLAAMAQVRCQNGIRWIRPLLSQSRQSLCNELTLRGITWSDDPSNHDTQFDRVRVRKLMQTLNITADGLMNTAARMRDARQVLEQETERAAREIANINLAGDVEILAKDFFALAPELRQRLLAHSLKFVASAPYRPRLDGLLRLLGNLEKGVKTTLAGCVCEVTKVNKIRVSREFSALKNTIAAPDQIWDGRWQLSSDAEHSNCLIAPLGTEGLSQCPNWRDTGLPRNSLLASPAVWQSGVLVAAPLAGFAQGWSCELARGSAHFFASALSH